MGVWQSVTLYPISLARANHVTDGTEVLHPRPECSWVWASWHGQASVSSQRTRSRNASTWHRTRRTTRKSANWSPRSAPSREVSDDLVHSLRNPEQSLSEQPGFESPQHHASATNAANHTAYTADDQRGYHGWLEVTGLPIHQPRPRG